MTNVIKRILFFVCLFILQIPSHSAKAVSNSVNADTVKVTLLNGVPAIDVKKETLELFMWGIRLMQASFFLTGQNTDWRLRIW